MKHSSIKLEKTKEPKMDVPRIVVKPGEGRSGSLGGMGVVFKVSGGGHGLGLRWRGTLDRIGGRLVLPHVHLHEDEIPVSWRGEDQCESRGP
jgi:hypothetical protein